SLATAVASSPRLKEISRAPRLTSSSTAALPPRSALQQEEGLGQHGLTGEQGGGGGPELRGCPFVVAVPAIDERDQRAGVHDDTAPHLPNPRMYFLLYERSPGPSTQPTRSPARSRTECGAGPYLPAK